MDPGSGKGALMDENRSYSFIITERESGIRLDRLLGVRFEFYNREKWQNRIRGGEVLVDGERKRPSSRMRQGQTVEFTYRKKKEPDINSNYDIIHEDDAILVIDKPANLPVHPSGVYFHNTLSSLLKLRYGEGFIAHFAHRLDRETSGVLLLAKNPENAKIMHRTFLSSRVHKEYVTFVFGNFPEYIDASGILIRDARSEIRKKRRFIPTMAIPDTGVLEAETARTEFFLIKRLNNMSLLRAVLHTGRTHQIRASLLGLGFPVVGDRLYGVDDRLYLKFIDRGESDEDRLILGHTRVALHCRLMEFPHPTKGEIVRFESPLPEDLRALIG
jgi:23S rRNA pseudouridine955/2504/2580 synthase/23S rRNA pseudouridine1911/1915/1917 synthase